MIAVSKMSNDHANILNYQFIQRYFSLKLISYYYYIQIVKGDVVDEIRARHHSSFEIRARQTVLGCWFQIRLSNINPHY